MTFKPGQSGNPAGRKPGTKNRKLEFLRSNDGKLQKKVLDMAMDGDVAALKIIADRLWPRLRAQPEPVNIESNSEDIAAQSRSAIDAALSGEITSDVLRDLLTAMYAHGRLIELTELEQRLAALEKSKHLAPWERRKELSPWQEESDDEESDRLPIRGKRRRAET